MRWLRDHRDGNRGKGRPMTLPLEQARLRAAVLKATGEAIRHADEAMVQAIHNRIHNSDRRCRKAFAALIKARLALKQWGRVKA